MAQKYKANQANSRQAQQEKKCGKSAPNSFHQRDTFLRVSTDTEWRINRKADQASSRQAPRV